MSRALISYLLYPLVERQQQRQILPKLVQMKAFAQLPREERQRVNQQRLYEAVAQAGQEVPYYRDLFQQHQFDPETIKTDSRYLKDLPYLTKEIVREQGDRLVSDQVNKAALHVRKTGGSTGPSTLVYYDQSGLDWTAAANLLVLEWTGKKRYMKEVHFSSRFPEPLVRREQLKEAIKCITLNRVNITTDTFDPDSLRRILQILKAERPYSVQGHPSTLYSLALLVEQDHFPAQGLFRVFESTGEVLDHKQRELIARVFACQIYNRYGNAEFGVVAHTEFDQTQNLRVLDYLVWPETRRTEADMQELVFTGLTNSAMPLLRYRTGDLGELIQIDGEFHITDIVGRVHDIVTLGDRRYPTHYIQDLLDRLHGIDEFQLEQVTPETLQLKLVLHEGANRDQIQQRVASWWGPSVMLEFVNFDSLKRQGWRAKFRHLVSSSEVTSEPPALTKAETDTDTDTGTPAS